jgi:trk system potassium uptake protein TrkA
VGRQSVKLQDQSGSRIAWIDRLGEGTLPTKDTVMQEGDLLHLVMREENAEKVYQAFNDGPEDE